MQRRFEELREALVEFVEQRETLMLVLWHKTPSGLAFSLKYLESMEQGTRRDLFLVFGNEFTDAAGYLDGLMSTCEIDIETANRIIADGDASEGSFCWESLPTGCFDAASPRDRLRALVEHIRRYYPDASHRIVLGLLPAVIEEPEAYAEFVGELVAWDGYEPWMAGVRILVADSRVTPRLVPRLAEEDAFGVEVLPLDFSPEAMQVALDESASDSSVADEDRVKSLVQLAALDHAHNRIEESVAKYRVAYNYYVREKNSVMQGLCLLGQGYALERAKQEVVARERFCQALELGIDNDSGQLMLNSLMALGGLEQRHEQWSVAATYYETAAGVAKQLSNPFSCADALLHGGVCQVALNDTAKAREWWEVGVTVGGQGQYWPRVVSLLEHLIEIERREGLDEERQVHERHLEAARHENLCQQHDIDEAKAAAEASAGTAEAN